MITRYWAYPARGAVLCTLMLLAACKGGKSADEPTTQSAPTYTKAQWAELPSTTDTEVMSGFLAWRSACYPRLAKDSVWAATCQEALKVAESPQAVRQFLQDRLDLYSLRAKGKPQGLITGYYEPIYSGSLEPDALAQVPVYGPPHDMISVALEELYPDLKGKRLRGRLEGQTLKPYADAAAIRAQGVDAPILAWLHDPMDLQFLQIQGSGRIQLADGRQLRLGYADQNGHPYRPVGRWLIEQGQLKKEEVSMRSIRDWAKAHPEQVPALLNSNPSYVFFTLRPETQEPPRGSLNVPLTAGYSVAIDRKVIPLGSLLWLSSTLPNGQSLIRPVAAQDTGGAIAGEVRADLFVGTGSAAGELAGDMKQEGALWLFWPKGMALPEQP